MIYIGIDFSLNSTSIVIKTNVAMFFISLVNTLQWLNIKPVKALSIHKQINELTNTTVIPFTRNKPSKDYNIDQQNKIKDANTLSNLIFNTIKPYISNKNEPVHIAIEGFSYASKGNSFIDLILFNSTVRNKFYNEGYLLNVYSPSEIKKQTGKGNANKVSMFNSFVKENINEPFHNFCKLNQDTLLCNDSIVKPIDDLVDAYYICKLLQML